MKQLSKSLLVTSQRQFSTASDARRDQELKIAKKIKQALSPTFISVQDTTLGINSCGSMYKIVVQSPFFDKKSKVEQWRLVAGAISDEMKSIHGFNLKTRIPSILSTQLNLSNNQSNEQVIQDEQKNKQQ